MNRAKVLIAEQLPNLEDDIKILSSYAEVKLSPSTSEEVLCREIADVDLLLVVYVKVNSRIIDSAPKLKGIVRFGIGIDNIDVQIATSRKILVVNIPDYAIDTVAEHAFALLISLARKITVADRVMRTKKWGNWTSPSKLYLGIDLKGKTLGIVGMGRIGRSLARKAEAFGMNLLAFDPYLEQEQLDDIKVKLTGLRILLKESDFVSIHVPHTPETRGLIGENQLRIMKKTAYIINTSRGPLIDEKALMKALKKKWICGAGLDVYEKEPPALNNQLLKLENVILTPHIAWYTEEASKRLEKLAIQRTVELLQGKIPKTVVNPEVLKQKT
ncbi:MAG: hydroxyacid dehydrogenase [Candidatus Bathyarchaeota archaeon]|nr:hydroxyacid dehydrogenase [Candidatus Bathyarchaeota archaeon]